MTVDSRYIPESYENDGEIYYPFQLESVGEAAFEVYKVTDLARTLLTLDYHYTIDFEEHLDPIKKRGRIKLAAPLSADGHLEVLRKTPIVNPFEDEPMEALKPFPTEAVENALDRICFIQQEIEGHLCDCRGPVWPPPPSVPDPDRPECQLYDCNAFAEYAAAEGYGSVDFGDIQGENPVLPKTFTLTTGGESSVTVPDQYDSIVGLPLGSGAFDTWDTGTLDLDPCSGKTRGLKLNDINVSPGSFDPTKLHAPSSSGIAILHKGSFLPGWSSVSSLLRRSYTFEVVFNDATVLTPSFSPSILWDPPYIGSGNGFVHATNSGTASFGVPVFNTESNMTVLQIISNGLTLIETFPGIPDLYMNVTYRAVTNGIVYESTYDHYIAGGGSYGGIASYSITGVGIDSLFTGAGAFLFALVHDTGLDADKMYTFYQQNFADWEAPEDCVLVYTEYPDTPDVPNIFGE